MKPRIMNNGDIDKEVNFLVIFMITFVVGTFLFIVTELHHHDEIKTETHEQHEN